MMVFELVLDRGSSTTAGSGNRFLGLARTHRRRRPNALLPGDADADSCVAEAGGEAEAAPTEAFLGVPIYPGAQFIAS